MRTEQKIFNDLIETIVNNVMKLNMGMERRNALRIKNEYERTICNNRP